MIDIKKLRQLIALMTENELTELDLRDGQEQVTLKRGAPPAAGGAMPPMVLGAMPGQPMAAAGGEPGGAPVDAAGGPAEEGLVEITSPMVGTFYAAASPDAEPFVRVGSTVEAETVVCLIEAMKVFNEIKAEVTGTIQKVLVDNGQAVEFGQPLFLVKPPA